MIEFNPENYGISPAAAKLRLCAIDVQENDAIVEVFDSDPARPFLMIAHVHCVEDYTDKLLWVVDCQGREHLYAKQQVVTVYRPPKGEPCHA